MRKNITPKQKAVYSVIKDLTAKLGKEPTLEQVRKSLSYKTVSSVQRHTDNLKDEGYLSKTRGLSLIVNSNIVQIPLVGNIAAGTPFLAEENIEAYIAYDSFKLRGKAEDYFFLRAIGDSMNASDISGKTVDNGDIVLVKKQNTADSGNRIVALIGDDATIKIFIPTKDKIMLMPESNNPANKPIIVFDDLMIQGIAVDVIKQKGDKSG